MQQVLLLRLTFIIISHYIRLGQAFGWWNMVHLDRFPTAITKCRAPIIAKNKSPENWELMLYRFSPWPMQITWYVDLQRIPRRSTGTARPKPIHLRITTQWTRIRHQMLYVPCSWVRIRKKQKGNHTLRARYRQKHRIKTGEEKRQLPKQTGKCEINLALRIPSH